MKNKKDRAGKSVKRGGDVTSQTFRRGATLVGAQHKNRSIELERIAERKKNRRKKVVVFGIFGIFLLLVGIFFANLISNGLAEQKKVEENLNIAKKEPSVAILDENSGTTVSERVKDFVLKLESDFKDVGQELDHVVLPFRMTREVDIYLKGRSEYYKLSVDRDSAVQAEDVSRMLNYVDKNSIKAVYVDVRVEGKAYYK